MKTRKIILGFLLLVTSALVSQVKAQFMPTVYDHIYGKGVNFDRMNANFQNGDVVATGVNEGHLTATWFDRLGESKLVKNFKPDEFTEILNLIPLPNGTLLLVGTYADAKRNTDAGGRAMVLTRGGEVKHDITLGSEGTRVTGGQLLPGGGMALCGDMPVSEKGRSAFVCVVTPDDRVSYTYVATAGETCAGVQLMNGNSASLCAAFSAGDEEGASIVRLDDNGKPYFITQLTDPTFRIEKMLTTNDGYIYVVGEGQKTGGAVIKVREEGAIVYQKQIIPVTSATRLNQLLICPTGEVLIGGNDLNNAYYALLRSDGTELTTRVTSGVIAGMTTNVATGDCIVSLYDPAKGSGEVVKLSRLGRLLFEKKTACAYTELRVNTGGDLLMGCASTGRLSMLSSLGELLFDRFVVENTPTRFLAATLPANGEAVFLGDGGRIVKLAHGVYLSDVQIMKPIAGMANAVFTVTLSGYSYSKEGAPLPVTVNYSTQPLTATEGLNFDSVAGTLSFIPPTDGSNRYLSKFTVEVPVKANDLLEGDRIFSLNLGNVKNSYLIRSTAKATIVDQPAVVQLIGTKPGVEGKDDIIYELGIFKTNGKPLTNSTRANIVVDGVYGKSTADALDYDRGRIPRLVIEPGKHSGTFNVVTREDTRYESVKNVVIDFSKIYAMSDVNLSFPSMQLSCSGLLYDQPAMVSIESLGNYGRNNNVISGFFKVSLLRARDGALQTNNSGSDIQLTVVPDSASTAVQGKDFVFTNIHDLRLIGDGNTSAVNLNGVVLYAPNAEKKIVAVELKDVKGAESASKISVDKAKSKASFAILGDN